MSEGRGSDYPMGFEPEPEDFLERLAQRQAREAGIPKPEPEPGTPPRPSVAREVEELDVRLASPDLIPRHLRSPDELDRWERMNVAEALIWIRSTRASPLSSNSIRTLHARMFDQTWKWAGKYRVPDPDTQTPKTLKTQSDLQLAPLPAFPREGGAGARADRIDEEIAKLIWTGSGWLERGSVPARDALLRLHHTLLRIRAFPDGNGRHARLWADWLARDRGFEPVGWRGDPAVPFPEMRARYTKAMIAADRGDYEPLNDLYGVRRIGGLAAPPEA